MAERAWKLRLPDGEVVDVVERVCKFGDPTCPCPDGLACHYVDLPDSPAMDPPDPVGWEQLEGELWDAQQRVRELEADRDSAWAAYTDLAEMVIGPEGVVTLGVEHDPDRAWMIRHWRAALEQCKAWKQRALGDE